MTTQNPLISMPERFITAQNGNLITTSINVATAFRKQHKNVIQKIKTLECGDAFLTANFSAVKNDYRGNDYTAYQMTKDGFMLLVMGFTGKAAMAVKIAYINAFNKMADELAIKNLASTIDDRTSPSNLSLLTSSNYRQQARDYLDVVLGDCFDFAKNNNINTNDWDFIDREKAVSGLLSDLLRSIRAEMSFDENLRPTFKILPSDAIYVMPSNPECMKAVVSRSVPINVLVDMINEGVKRLAADRIINKK